MPSGRRLLASIGLLLVAFLAHPALAQPVWTRTANTCAVDNTDGDEFDPNSASLKFRSLRKGTIVVRCNVTNANDDGSDPAWHSLEVVYRDQDGSASRNQVRARLIRVGNGGNDAAVAELDSNLFPVTPEATLRSVNFTHDFDFNTGAYYVELRLSRDRTGPDHDPAAWIVRLAP